MYEIKVIQYITEQDFLMGLQKLEEEFIIKWILDFKAESLHKYPNDCRVVVKKKPKTADWTTI